MEDLRRFKSEGIIKILYIQYGIDEKLSSIKLEEETAHAIEGCTCVFTVVADVLIGLECTEHTPYNLIMVENSDIDPYSAYSFLHSLRTVGARMPVVLLQSGTDSSDAAAALSSPNPPSTTGNCDDPMDSDINGSNSDSDYEERNLGLPPSGFDAVSAIHYSAILRMPFTKRDLCDLIRSAIFTTNSSVHTRSPQLSCPRMSSPEEEDASLPLQKLAIVACHEHEALGSHTSPEMKVTEVEENIEDSDID